MKHDEEHTGSEGSRLNRSRSDKSAPLMSSSITASLGEGTCSDERAGIREEAVVFSHEDARPSAVESERPVVAGVGDVECTAAPFDDSMSAKNIIRRTVWATVILLVASLLASWLFRDWLTAAGTYLIGEYGGRGVFTSVFFIDWFPVPASPEPIFLLGISAGMGMKELFIAAASGGVVAALGCYASGAVLERTTPIGEWVNRKHPALVRWVEAHGYKGLALAAIIPLPFSPMMWIAGIIGMPLERVVAISLLRIIKTAFYLYIIAIGWALT